MSNFQTLPTDRWCAPAFFFPRKFLLSEKNRKKYRWKRKKFPWKTKVCVKIDNKKKVPVKQVKISKKCTFNQKSTREHSGKSMRESDFPSVKKVEIRQKRLSRALLVFTGKKKRWCAPAYLFLPWGSSKSPTPASAEGASSPNGWVGEWVGGCGSKESFDFLYFECINKQHVKQNGTDRVTQCYLWNNFFFFRFLDKFLLETGASVHDGVNRPAPFLCIL